MKSMKSIMVLILFLTTIAFIYGHDALAETNIPDPTTLSWVQIAISGVSAAIVSSAISAIINYRITLKQIEKNYDSTMKQLKGQRQVDSIKEKVSVYSFFIFNLDRMISNPEFRQATEPTEKIKKTIEEIEDELKGRYYLLDPKVAEKWMSSRHDLKSLKNLEINFPWPEGIKDHVVEIRNDLTKEYNGTICSQYREIVGISLNNIRPNKRSLNSEDSSS